MNPAGLLALRSAWNSFEKAVANSGSPRQANTARYPSRTSTHPSTIGDGRNLPNRASEPAVRQNEAARTVQVAQITPGTRTFAPSSHGADNSTRHSR